MAQYNTSFELDVNDLELIEAALRMRKSELSLKRLSLLAENPPADDDLAQIDETIAGTHDLLGRLHNQKVWYRPKTEDKVPYIGG